MAQDTITPARPALGPRDDAAPAGLLAVGPAACDDTVASTLGALLAAERVAAAFYYAALTAPAVLRDPRLCGSSADPNNPGLPPGGRPQHVRYLQAALDAEMKHIAMLAKAGAASSARSFFFPAATFERLGSPQEPASFLGVLEILETVVIGAYITAAAAFLRLGRPDLSMTAAQVMGVEAEHRTLGRVIAAMTPPNNVTIERAPYSCMGEVAAALSPFLTGRRFLFAAGPAAGASVPTAAQANRVIGKYATRAVPRYQFGPNGA